MRIKKTSNTRAIAGKVVNVPSESTTDAYSCDYVNKLTNVENLTMPTITQTLTYNASGSYFKKCGNVYDLSLRATINSGTNINTEYKIMNNNFGVYACGIITSAGDSSMIGTFIINTNGMYINLSKIVNAIIVLKVTWIN